MAVYTITLTDAEQRAMEYVATDVNFWIQNAVHERARLAMEELVANHIAAKLAAGASISGTKEEIVMASDLPNAQARSDAMVKRAVLP
jgi:hypothetical protein